MSINKKAKVSKGEINFVYFDIGGVLFDFQPALQGVSQFLGQPIGNIQKIFEKYDLEVCRGLMQPEDLWQKFQQQTETKRKGIHFIDFLVEHFIPIEESHELV